MTNDIPALRTVNVTRYVTPLREGSSLPAIVEADDDGLYVLKFRGAGQGIKALIAELLAGEIARALGLRVPDIVLANLVDALSRMEPDPEIRELLHASAGLNLALDFLPGSITFNPLAGAVDPRLASQIVWFDCLVTNVDRTPRNANLLVWHRNIWLIDHGASLYFHHDWKDYMGRSRAPFTRIKDHALLSFADNLREADSAARTRLTAKVIQRVVELIPGAWLNGERRFASQAEHRQAYVAYLLNRLEASSLFVEEARHARTQLV